MNLYVRKSRSGHHGLQERAGALRGRWVASLVVAVVAVSGCEASSGPGGSAGQKSLLPNRDVDKQVDAVIKDFRNE